MAVFNYIDTIHSSAPIHESLLPLYILSQSFDALFCGWMCTIVFYNIINKSFYASRNFNNIKKALRSI